MLLFRTAPKTSKSKDLGGKTPVNEILTTTYEENVRRAGLNATRLYSRGNVCLQLGNVKTREQFNDEIQKLHRPDFDLLKAKKS